PSNEQAKPWFTARVMAAIEERESKLARSLETWTVLPRLASRLAWGAALALVLMTTWLAGLPKTTQSRPVRTDISGEPGIESHPVPATNDDVLASLSERVVE